MVAGSSLCLLLHCFHIHSFIHSFLLSLTEQSLNGTGVCQLSLGKSTHTRACTRTHTWGQFSLQSSACACFQRKLQVSLLQLLLNTNLLLPFHAGDAGFRERVPRLKCKKIPSLGLRRWNQPLDRKEEGLDCDRCQLICWTRGASSESVSVCCFNLPPDSHLY